MSARQPLVGRLTQFVQRRPAIPFLILVAIGIGLAPVFPVRPGLFLAGAALLLIGAIPLRQRLIRFPLLATVTILVGLCSAQIARYQFPSDIISAYASADERLAQVELSIGDPPRFESPSPDELRELPPKQTTVAKVQSILTHSGWVPASGYVALTLDQPNVALRPGQTIRAIGLLAKPSGPSNPGEFDYADYCREQRIAATLVVEHADGVQILQDPGPGPLATLRLYTRHLLALGFDQSRAFDHLLLRAFVLGDSVPELRDLEDQFTRTGAIHYLAITGLHIAIVGAIVLWVCRLVRISPRVAAWTALFTVLLYATVADPTWPAWRSIILCSAATIAILSRRFTDTIHLFCASVAAVLLIHPADLSSGGFQISFAAVLAMIVFTSPAERKFWEWWRGPDPAPSNPPTGHLRAAVRSLGRFVLSIFVASAIAWAVALPLIAYHFGQINAWSAPAGIVLLPITVLALTFGIAKILLTLAWPSGAPFWAMLAIGPILILRYLVEGMSRLPGATLWIPRPAIAVPFAYYGLLALLLVPIRRPLWRWSVRVAVPLACLVLLFLPTLTAAVASVGSQPRAVTITLLSVGAGQAAVIRTSPGHALLVDAGSTTISDVGHSVIIPWLRYEGCRDVDGIFLTQCQFDRLSAATELFHEYGGPAVYTSPQFQTVADGNYPAEVLLATLRVGGKPPIPLHQGDRLSPEPGVSVDVLWPPVDDSLSTPECGLVLKLGAFGKTVLFPSGIGAAAERRLLLRPKLLRSDILVLGGATSSMEYSGAFLRAVGARFILESNGRRPARGQRRPALFGSSSTVYSTNQRGAIDLTIQPSGDIEVTPFLDPSGQRRR